MRATPSGIWSHEDYEKLRLYDGETWDQPTHGFACHASPDNHCYGWAVVHSRQPDTRALLALRINWPDGGIPDNPDIELFTSGTEAADHGQADIDNPGPAARDAINRLVRRYPRLRDQP